MKTSIVIASFILLVVSPFVNSQTLSPDTPATIEHVDRVNINKASAKEIADRLSGIGVTKAEKIVELRSEIGHFVEIEQLLLVKGIGKKTIERNLDKIQL